MHVVRRLRPRHVGSSAAGLTRESVSGGTPRHGSAAHRRTRALARRRGEGAPDALREGGRRLRRAHRAGPRRQSSRSWCSAPTSTRTRSTSSSSARSSPRSPRRPSRARWCSPRACRGVSRPTPCARLRHLHPGDDRRGHGHRARREPGGHRRRHRVHVATRPSSPAARWPTRWCGRPRRAASPSKLQPFQKLKPKDLVPVPPAIAEYSTGLTMGESAEKMAKENGISREEQDEIALASHQQRRRARGRTGVFDAEVMHVPVPPRYRDGDAATTSSARDTSLEALVQAQAGVRPQVRHGHRRQLVAAHRRRRGAAAHERGEGEGARATSRSATSARYAYAALDPGEQLLRARPTPRPSRSSAPGMTLGDIDLVEMHEAFAAQVLCNLQAFASQGVREEAGRSAPLGEVDRREAQRARAAPSPSGTRSAPPGARIVTRLCNELKRRGQELGAVHRLRRRRPGRRRGPGACVMAIKQELERSRASATTSRTASRSSPSTCRRAGEHAVPGRRAPSSPSCSRRAERGPRGQGRGASSPASRTASSPAPNIDFLQTLKTAAEAEALSRSGAGGLRSARGLRQAGGRRHPRRVPRRRPRDGARLPLPHRHRQPEDRARPARGAARPHPRRRRHAAAAAR